MSIGLTQDTLSKYFAIADSSNSYWKIPTNTFNFINRDSDALVVTVGDSWTWGSDISIKNTSDQERLDCVYGNVVANALNADWLNLSIPGQGNFWIAEKVEELAKIIPQLEYNRIYVICTLTGIGRWFNSKFDQHIDYVDWFNDIGTDFDQLLIKLNRYCLERIAKAVNIYNNVTLKVGTNFVEPLGFDPLRPEQILPSPWYTLLGTADSSIVYTCAYADQMPTAINFIKPKNQLAFKTWLIDIITKSERRVSQICWPDRYRNCHLVARGHKTWANYILKEITVD